MYLFKYMDTGKYTPLNALIMDHGFEIELHGMHPNIVVLDRLYLCFDCFIDHCS